MKVHSSVSIYILVVFILFEFFSYVFVFFVCVEKWFVHIKHPKFRRFNIMYSADCSFRLPIRYLGNTIIIWTAGIGEFL